MIRKIICINSAIIAMLAVFFFIYPPARAALSIRDPALSGPGVPKAAGRLYRNLTPRYASWARARVGEGKAARLPVNNISGTEWPLFGSVFYLWAIENLQAAWEGGDHTAGLEPRVFAQEAVIAASDLVLDPGHATWVKRHWGTNYLHQENVFYRMLVIAALTSREHLLRDGSRTSLLRDQVETLTQELDASKTGLLDDYPGECYPGDVMTAIMCIRRADGVLHKDHAEFVERSLRAFTGNKVTRHGLPPYAANSASGLPISEARGCGNSYICIAAPELWPDQANQWQRIYDEFFWQERLGAVGYREFPKDVPKTDWMMDVDAGPVIAGHGIAASAFGVGAARKNGRFDRAYPLSAEMLTTAWELPNGVLAGPRMLSNLSDAPMLGEAAILWQLTIQPQPGFTVKQGGSIPAFAYIMIVTAFLLGIGCLVGAIRTFKAARREPEPEVWRPYLQTSIWVVLILGSLGTLWTHLWWAGLFMLMGALLLPGGKKSRERLAEPINLA